MKNYLAVFLGKPEAMDKWRAMPEAERRQREKAGIEAWHKWVADHQDAIVDMGSPLGKTKRTDKNGVSDTLNELGAWTVVRANSQEDAAKLFLNHPHFMIFPGDRVGVLADSRNAITSGTHMLGGEGRCRPCQNRVTPCVRGRQRNDLLYHLSRKAISNRPVRASFRSRQKSDRSSAPVEPLR